MSIIDVAYALTAPVEAVVFFMMMDAIFERRRAFSIWQFAAGIVVLTAMIRMINSFLLFRVGNAFGMILAAVLVSLYFYRASWLKRVFVILFFWLLLLGVVEMLVLNVMCLIFGISATEVLTTPAYLLLGIIVSKALDLAVGYAFCMKNRMKIIEINKTYWLIFFLLFTSAVVTTFLILGMLSELNSSNYNIMAMVSCIGLYASTFLALYLYARSQQQNQIIRYQEQAEQQMQAQLKHMDEIILRQNELRAFRHDINNQLTALSGYLDAGDLAGSRQYLAGISDHFKSASPAINTGNNALDAILSAKRALAENHGIRFTSKLRVQENLPIAPEDLCIIFGNALDNAIEACDRLPADAERTIALHLLQDAHTLTCIVTNTASSRRGASFVTSKADKAQHGFGLNNIREALDKYGVTPEITWEDGRFTLAFVFLSEFLHPSV